MSDNTLQFKWIVVIKEGLEALFGRNPAVFVAGNLSRYAVKGEPENRIAPDVTAVFGRPKSRRGSYMQWEKDGIPPHVVVEILSRGHRPGEVARKFEFYDNYGVSEFYLYDPDSGLLEGWPQAGNRLKSVTDISHFASPQRSIRFEPVEGADNLTIVGHDGERFLTYSELVDQRKAAETRADSERRMKEAERRMKEAERRLKEAAHERAERYAAKLRELGIEPDADDGRTASSSD